MPSVRTALAIRSKKKCHLFERLRLSVRTARATHWKKMSSVGTARAIRSKQLSAALLVQTTFTRAVGDEPVKKCKLKKFLSAYIVYHHHVDFYGTFSVE